MFSKEQFLNSLRHETAVCKHLASKASEDMLDYRPTPKQRSMKELLRYLCGVGIVPLKCVLEGDWSRARTELDQRPDVDLSNFNQEMDRQMAEIEQRLAPLPEEELITRKSVLPLNRECILGEGMVNTSLKFMAAYKMQLFLYLKMCGKDELSTINCWVGIDKPA